VHLPIPSIFDEYKKQATPSSTIASDRTNLQKRRLLTQLVEDDYGDDIIYVVVSSVYFSREMRPRWRRHCWFSWRCG